MNEQLRKARVQLDSLIVWADDELDIEWTDRQYLLEQLLRRLSELAAEMEKDESANGTSQTATVESGGTVIQIAGSLYS